MAKRSATGLEVSLGALALAQAIVVAVVSAGAPELRRPVVARLPGAGDADGGADGALAVATIDVPAASVVLLGLVAIVRLGAAVPALRRWRASAADHGTHGYRWGEAAFVWPILVFLVAQLNGISDIGALVAIYALSSAVALFACLQDRALRASLWPFSFGTMVGIVPWGIIAFHQIGAGLVGQEPSLGLRVVTLAMLAAVLVTWTLQWREAKRAAVGARPGADSAFAVTSFAAVSLFAWLTVLAPL
ncbi:hypothetical protein [Marisediminicola sp. LYQ85]|uniref:hypothetical protein n=1 Tax=Marisediminicola sp. LYQ85 TaxID=3391062 RepID=UPI0039837846